MYFPSIEKGDTQMKFQNLAVIFAIIVIPISLIMSAVIQSNIDTINMQTSYDTKLSNATYDAVKAFQLNTINSEFSTVQNAKLDDIEASASIFFTTLANNLGVGGYNEDVLKTYVPALVYTLYDGYYIYAPYRNTENGNKLESGIKPYVYYTCRYVNGNNDFIVNYTLDNYIIIYGTVNGQYVTKSGFLINPDNFNGSTYKGNTISKENLSENMIMRNGNTYQTTTLRYKYYNGQTVYTENNGASWFTYKAENKNEIKGVPAGVEDTSALSYYQEAKEFSQWVNANLSNISASDAKEIGGQTIEEFKGNNAKIFAMNNSNDPDDKASQFNEHRRRVIKRCIQDNLNNAIANYNNNSQGNNSTYNFKMPILTESDWDKLLDNICVISFMQGIPIGSKYYNGYTIVPNNKNKEVVNSSSIYFVSDDGEYHDINCTDIAGKNIIGYSNIDFERRSIPSKDASGEQIYNYYCPHDNTGDYECIVSSNKLQNKQIDALSQNVKNAYYTALGRIKYGLYKTNAFGIN